MGGSSGWCISFDCPPDLLRLISALHCPLLKIDPGWKAGESARLFSPGQMALCPPSPASLDFRPWPLWFLASHPYLLSCSSTASLCFSPQLPFGEGLFHFYPQDASKRRNKRITHRRQQLQKDKRVSVHAVRIAVFLLLNLPCSAFFLRGTMVSRLSPMFIKNDRCEVNADEVQELHCCKFDGQMNEWFYLFMLIIG